MVLLRTLFSLCFLVTGISAFASSAGSGFFISDDGYFVTNFHVVAGGTSFAIRTVNNKRYTAKLVRSDKANDLAILKTEGEFTPIPIEDSLNVKRGAKVITIGFPHLDVQGIEPKVTEGIVNSLTGIKDDPRYFQISVQVGNGNSGGPLINTYGNVVGIVSGKLSTEAVYASSGDMIQNVNYAVKSNYLRELANSIPDLQDKLVLGNTETFTDTESLTSSIENSIGMVINFSPSNPTTSSPPVPRAGKVFRDCSTCPEMVPLPPSGKITRSFAIGKYEVTQSQWRAIMGNNPSYFKNCGANCPVEQVSWEDVQDFIKKLSAKTGKEYRLPTSEEWEYACRAESTQKYCGSDNIDSVAWYLNNSRESANPVGRKLPNTFGLYDMSGNVWEWLGDCINSACSKYILRGGSWLESSQFARAVDKDAYDPEKSFSFIGFRLARSLP